MTNWTRRPVGDLIDGLAAGVSVRSMPIATGGAAVLKTSAVDAGRFDPREAKPILPADLPRARRPVAADSMIVSRMNTPAMVGDVGYVAEAHDDIYLPDRLWLARAKQSSGTNMRWLTYYFASDPGARELRGLATGTSGSMKNIPKDRILDLEINVPPAVEQRVIAEALGDAEDLIAALERLIAKKQAIKQGMMQQLLTGRTRMPGFFGDWMNLRAGDLGSFKGGSSFAPRYQGARSGSLPFFKVSDMNNDGNELFMRRANNYVTEAQRKSMGAVLMPAGAIVFAKVGAAVFLERKRILTTPSCIDNNMAAYAVDKDMADVRFMHYFLHQFPMSSLVATGALPSLNGRQLRSIPISLPEDLREQCAIAGVLADVDEELDATAVRLAKARAVKTGMVQQLLTGRTRLPAKVAA